MVRFAPPQCVAALLVALGCSAPAAAQDFAPPDANAVSAAMPSDASAPRLNPSLLGSANQPTTEKRPAALVPLYASFVGLQILDLHSTSYALQRGAVEANPAMRGFVENQFAMAAVKAAGTAGLIFVSEKLRTKNKAASLALMIASNTAMTWVVQHNYRTAR